MRRQAESLEVAMGQASHDSMKSLRHSSIGGYNVKFDNQHKAADEGTRDNLNTTEKKVLRAEFKALRNVEFISHDSELNQQHQQYPRQTSQTQQNFEAAGH